MTLPKIGPSPANHKPFPMTSAHPSPLSVHRGFFGSKPFSQTNNFLVENDIEPIDWKLK